MATYRRCVGLVCGVMVAGLTLPVASRQLPTSQIAIPLGASPKVQFTDAAHGVLFDIDGDGARDQVAWFADPREAGWLAIDKNHNGIIDDGSELIGSHFSPTAASGFHALYELNPKVAEIGPGNATFDALLIWRDTNRDGICQLGEVFPASRVLAKVYLGWLVKRRLDANGNGSQAQGFADFKDATGPPVEIYDVILATL